MKTRFLLAGLAVCVITVASAAPPALTESTFTEVINDVNVVVPSTHAAAPAKVNELFKTPNLVRTGPASRTELTAPDQTITRVGANTVFSFEPAGRNLNLEKGSILFHSPSGKGGGTIKSGGAAAAVLGTTIIVAATENGGFKVVVVEHKCKVTLPNKKSVTLNAGQMVFVLPGQSDFGPVLDINLGKLVAGSLLVNGFSHELPSSPKIHEAIKKQDYELSTGRAEDTGVSADNPAGKLSKRRRVAGSGMNAVDNNSYQTAVSPTVPASRAGLLLQGEFPPGMTTPGGRGFVVIGPK